MVGAEAGQVSQCQIIEVCQCPGKKFDFTQATNAKLWKVFEPESVWFRVVL